MVISKMIVVVRTESSSPWLGSPTPKPLVLLDGPIVVPGNANEDELVVGLTSVGALVVELPVDVFVVPGVPMVELPVDVYPVVGVPLELQNKLLL